MTNDSGALVSRLIATVEQNWDARQRPLRAMLELTLAHALKKISTYGESDARDALSNAKQIIEALRNARTLSAVKYVILSEQSRAIGLDSEVLRQIESGRLIESAESYIVGSIVDSQSFLEQALSTLGNSLAARYAEPLMSAIAGVPLISKEDALNYLTTELTSQINDAAITPALIESALQGDQGAAQQIQHKIIEYTKEKIKNELATFLNVTPTTLASSIDAFTYGQELAKKWDPASTAEKMQMVASAAKAVNSLLGNNKQISEIIGNAERGAAICAAAVAFQAATGWGAVFAGMQVAGALGGMAQPGTGAANDNAAVLAALQKIMAYLKEQFALLNTKLDAISTTLQQIQQAIDQLQYSIDLANAHLLAVRQDIRLLQEQVTNVGRLVAVRYARAEEAKCITLLEARPTRTSDALIACLAVHAQRVINASDPLQTLEIPTSDTEAQYEQLHRYCQINLSERQAQVPWSSLRAVLNLYEAAQTRACPLRSPVDFNEVFQGTKDFLDLVNYLLKQESNSCWLDKKRFRNFKGAALSLLTDMSSQCTRAQQAEEYLRPLSTAELLGRVTTSLSLGASTRQSVDSMAAKEKDETETFLKMYSADHLEEGKHADAEKIARQLHPYSRALTSDKCLQDRLLHSIERQVQAVCAAWEKLELGVACEVILDSWDLAKPPKIDGPQFLRRWGVALETTDLQIADTVGWPASNVRPILFHSTAFEPDLVLGLTRKWTLSGVEPLQARFLLESRRNEAKDAKGTNYWYQFDLDVNVKIGVAKWALQHNLVPKPVPHDPPDVSTGHTQVIGFAKHGLGHAFEYLPKNDPPSSTARKTIPAGTGANAAAELIFAEYGNHVPPEVFWNLSRNFASKPLNENPLKESYLEQLKSGAQNCMIDGLNHALSRNNLTEAIRALNQYNDPAASSDEKLAFKLLPGYLTWLSDASVLPMLVDRVLDGEYAKTEAKSSERVRRLLEDGLYKELITLDRLIDTLICICAATARASLASNTQLHGLLWPVIAYSSAGQTEVQATEYYLQQVAFLGHSRLVADGLMPELKERLRARRAGQPGFTFRNFMEEGFQYFEKCMFNLWLDACHRGNNLQIRKIYFDIEQAKKLLAD